MCYLGLELRERPSGFLVHRCLRGKHLPAANDAVDVKRFKLNAVTDSTGPFGRDDGGPTSKKRVEDNVVTRTAIEDGIGDHRRRLDGG
jgi:hypothetical protein